MQVHYAQIGLVRVKSDGTAYNVSNSPLSIKESLDFTTEHRMIHDTSIPNTANSPTIQQYLTLEANDGFEPIQVAQYFVLTKLP